MALEDEIKKNYSKVFRRAFIKRRLASTGLFESDWLEISKDVKRWGSITQKIDSEKQGRIRFSSANVIMINDDGKYNPSENDSSLWFGFASQQRTLFKLEAGFINQTLGADGVWTNTEFPSSNAEVYTGILQGDINVNTKNEMNFSIKPLTQILRDYPAKNLTGFTSTGITASDFIEMVRDQTDSNGSYIFRPFFGDTTSNWNIQTTTVTYVTLDSAGSTDVIDKNVWQIVERLAESENYLAYVDATGVFNFTARDNIASSTTYNFNGVGSSDRDFGIQIKDITYFGFRQSKYYSRVSLRHNAADTTTSYEIKESNFEVAGANSPWNFGHKTFSMENTWLSATSAETIAQQVFDNVSSAKKEIEFKSSFVPHLTIVDRLGISYDSNPVLVNSLWDLNDWESGSDAQTLDQLIDTGAAGINNTRYEAQSFLTPAGGMVVDTINMYMYQFLTATGSVHLELWSTSITALSDYAPKSLLTTSDSKDVSALGLTATIESFNFATAYTLTSEVNYAIVMTGLSVTSGIVVTRNASTVGSVYPDGKQWSSNDLVPTTWNKSDNNDFYFEIIQSQDSYGNGDSLVWDANAGNAILLESDEYKPLIIKLNLDKLETIISAREI